MVKILLKTVCYYYI